MLTKIIAGILFAFVIGCAPNPIEQPTAVPEPTALPPIPEWLNDNPDLEFGGSKRVRFESANDGIEFIRQSWPDGYELYEVVENYPVRVNYTGAGYSVQPRNTYGSIGYRLPPMTLSPDKYIIKVCGTAQIEIRGEITDVELRAHYTIEGTPGGVFLGISDVIRYPGPFCGMFTLNAPQLGVYNIAVYMRLIFPSMTASSFMTFERITVEVAPD